MGVFVIPKVRIIIWCFIHLASNLWSFFFTIIFRKRTSSPPPLLKYLFSCLCYNWLLLLNYRMVLVVFAFLFKKTHNLSVFCLNTDARPLAALLFSSCHLPFTISKPICFSCFQLVRSSADNRRGGTGLKWDELCHVRGEPLFPRVLIV